MNIAVFPCDAAWRPTCDCDLLCYRKRDDEAHLITSCLTSCRTARAAVHDNVTCPAVYTAQIACKSDCFDTLVREQAPCFTLPTSLSVTNCYWRTVSAWVNCNGGCVSKRWQSWPKCVKGTATAAAKNCEKASMDERMIPTYSTCSKDCILSYTERIATVESFYTSLSLGAASNYTDCFRSADLAAISCYETCIGDGCDTCTTTYEASTADCAHTLITAQASAVTQRTIKLAPLYADLYTCFNGCQSTQMLSNRSRGFGVCDAQLNICLSTVENFRDKQTLILASQHAECIAIASNLSGCDSVRAENRCTTTLANAENALADKVTDMVLKCCEKSYGAKPFTQCRVELLKAKSQCELSAERAFTSALDSCPDDTSTANAARTAALARCADAFRDGQKVCWDSNYTGFQEEKTATANRSCSPCYELVERYRDFSSNYFPIPDPWQRFAFPPPEPIDVA